MAEIFTDKLKLTKRDTGDLNWGAGHNANLDLLDAYAQQGTLRPPRTLLGALGAGAAGSELQGGSSYFFKVTAINAAGETTENIIPTALEVQVNQPAIPLEVILQWEVVKGAAGYRIYKSGVSGEEKFLAEVLGESTLTYTDTGEVETGSLIPVPSENTAFTSIRKIMAGAGIFIDPPHGTGEVTISATGGGGGGSFPLISPDGAAYGYAFANGGGNDAKIYFDSGQIRFDIGGGMVQLAANEEFDIYANNGNTSVELKQGTEEIIFTSQGGQIFGIYGMWIQLNTDGQIRFVDGAHYTAIKQAAGITETVVYELPGADGSPGQVLATDGSGTLSWASGPAPGFPLNGPDGDAEQPTYAFTGIEGLGSGLWFDNGAIAVGVSVNQIPVFDFLQGGARVRDFLFLSFEVSDQYYVKYNNAEYAGLWFYAGGNPVLTLTSSTVNIIQLGDQSNRVMNSYFASIDATGTINAQRLQVDPNGLGEGIFAKSFPVFLDNDENVKLQADAPSGGLTLYSGNPGTSNFWMRWDSGNNVIINNGAKLYWAGDYTSLGSEYIAYGTGWELHGALSIYDGNNLRFYFSTTTSDLVISDDGAQSSLGKWEFRANVSNDSAKLVLMQTEVVPSNWNGTSIVFGRDSNPHFDIVSRSTSSVYFEIKDNFASGQNDSRDPAFYFNIISGGNAPLSHFDFSIDGNIRGKIQDAQAELVTASGSELRLDDANTLAHLAVPTGFVIDMKVASDISAQFDEAAGADETRILLWDSTAGSLKRVRRGGMDSGGAGYRALVIEN